MKSKRLGLVVGVALAITVAASEASADTIFYLAIAKPLAVAHDPIEHRVVVRGYFL